MSIIEEYIERAKKSGKDVYIRGAAQIGVFLGTYLDTIGIIFKGFVDSSIDKQNKIVYEKYNCFSPDEVTGNSYVLIAVYSDKAAEEIANELDKRRILHSCNLRDSVYECLKLVDDEIFVRALFQSSLGYELNLANPKTMCEKIQWLKLYNRNPEYIRMVDKYEVKKYIKEKIGEEYIIPLYGVWDSFEEIEFDKLPNQFVLKCTHDSGTFVVVKDKSSLDMENAKVILEKGLRKNYFYENREWPYKNVQPRIIAEKYIDSLGKPESIEYKISCFDGKVGFLTICGGIAHAEYEKRTNDHYDVNFNHMPWWTNYKNAKIPPEKPKQWDKLIELSEILSKDIPYVRVDFYVIDGEIFFGEFTFFTWSGIMKFNPPEWDNILGNYIKLPLENIVK